ncbi:MAG: two-component system response regulator [Arcobacter sp.]|nr:MAG: two-component system response regulator [Arcobacter sp.]
MDFFKDEPLVTKILKKKKLKIVVADDEEDVHILTRNVLRKFEYDNKELEIISTYTGKETIEVLKQNPDVVLLLLDVIMETDDAGLEVCKKIRNELNNHSIQIILRTGQASDIPPYTVVTEYEINDYKEKTELSSEKLKISLITAIRAYENIKELKEANEKIEFLIDEIVDTQKEVIFRLGSVAETRSQETGMHVKRVAEYSKLFALYSGLNEDEAEILKQASPMHDIGKIGIPDNILNKPGKLNAEEFEIMKTHATIGYEMLKGSDKSILKVAAIVANEHHEKYDGSGYPRALKGEDIHIYGRITAIADVFDALGSDRCYKVAWDDERIFNLFKEERAKHFDPKLVDIFFDKLPEFFKIRDTFKD